MDDDRIIRVLIVDDHDIVRDGLCAVLGRQRDIEVIAEAGNGQEAVLLFREHRPDITLMDVRMPVMNGIEAMRTICAEFPDARIIIMSAAESDNFDHARTMGAAASILKDFTRQELLSTIRSVYANHGCRNPGARN